MRLPADFKNPRKTIAQAQAPSPVFFARPRAGPSSLVPPIRGIPSGCEGMARQGALPSSVSVRISLRRCGSASRRAVKVEPEMPANCGFPRRPELDLPTILPTTHVRFAPESGHVRCKNGCPLRANSGHGRLFNHLVGTQKHCLRKLETE
jgi:ribosomal protein L37E